MKTTDRYNHVLRFRIGHLVPKKYIDDWTKLKSKCEGEYTDTVTWNKKFVHKILFHCKNPSNKNLPYLKRVEGGLGGDNNYQHKQIHFRFNPSSLKLDNDIVLKVYNSESGNECWTWEELDDIIQSFSKVLSLETGIYGIEGCIEMTNDNMLVDDDDDCNDESDY